jgi:hypothetical protein
MISGVLLPLTGSSISALRGQSADNVNGATGLPHHRHAVGVAYHAGWQLSSEGKKRRRDAADIGGRHDPGQI